MRILAFVAAVYLGLAPAAASAQNTGSELPERSGAFRIVVQTNKSAYVADDPILIRVAIENVSSRHYKVQCAPTYYLVSLVVRDALGNIQPTTGYSGYVRLDSHFWDIAPGNAIHPGSYSPEDNGWIAIDHWRYALPAGTYTIEAAPRFDAFEVNQDGSLGTLFRISRVPSSNTVKISVRDKPAAQRSTPERSLP